MVRTLPGARIDFDVIARGPESVWRVLPETEMGTPPDSRSSAALGRRAFQYASQDSGGGPRIFPAALMTNHPNT